MACAIPNHSSTYTVPSAHPFFPHPQLPHICTSGTPYWYLVLGWIPDNQIRRKWGVPAGYFHRYPANRYECIPAHAKLPWGPKAMALACFGSPIPGPPPLQHRNIKKRAGDSPRNWGYNLDEKMEVIKRLVFYSEK